MDDGDDEILKAIKRNVKTHLTLLREKKFAELRKFLDETYSAKPAQRHAYECEVLWEEGKQDQALEETVARLKSGDYNVNHIILCATYAWKLRRKDVADYLGLSFKSKELETSSVVLAQFVYRDLNGLEISEDMRHTAWMLGVG
ncbi:MAG: hypothetical protein EOQ50_32140 [Mesorhizobium sp.]|uniref:hypothetical protein n=1 Tax=Mesorhizobium sp. TaxID=1871066 RepID=UPI000FE6476D|nr:hypothetical protein [Mesorhizobium sp.]RWB66675.1 MAG: hypothetical protein EOQ50_32140 [Mesorhizobium sp.]